jgi:hypothetical protein
MPKKYEDPVITPSAERGGDKTSTETHPAYAQIGASRSQGGQTVLYGSDFVHNGYMSVRIYPSQKQRSLSRDWFSASVTPYIEVMMTEAQWATFVSTPNSGMGVPCTMSYRNGEQIPAIPEPVDRVEQFSGEMSKTQAAALRYCEEMSATIEELPVAEKNKKALRSRLHMIQMTIDKNVPFVAKQFSEHVEKTAERAKIEVHAYAQGIISRLGLEAIAKNLPFVTQGSKQLGDGE